MSRKQEVTIDKKKQRNGLPMIVVIALTIVMLNAVLSSYLMFKVSSLNRKIESLQKFGSQLSQNNLQMLNILKMQNESLQTKIMEHEEVLSDHQTMLMKTADEMYRLHQELRQSVAAISKNKEEMKNDRKKKESFFDNLKKNLSGAFQKMKQSQIVDKAGDIYEKAASSVKKSVEDMKKMSENAKVEEQVNLLLDNTKQKINQKKEKLFQNAKSAWQESKKKWKSWFGQENL